MRIYLAIVLLLYCVFMPEIIRAEEVLGSQPSADNSIKKLVIPLRVAAIVSTTATAVIWSKYYVTHRDYMDATEIKKISEYYDNANKYYKLRNGFIVATGLLWAANLATLFINPPPEEVDEFSPYGVDNTILSRWKIQRDAENRLSLSWNIRF